MCVSASYYCLPYHHCHMVARAEVVGHRGDTHEDWSLLDEKVGDNLGNKNACTSAGSS